jgi:transglutaminase-like putative cysteine protease
VKLERLHHRLVVGMGLAGVLAGWGGVLLPPVALAGAVALAGTLAWRPTARRRWIETVFVAVVVLLTLRAGYVVVVDPETRLLAMVDVLLALLVAEAWKPAGRASDIRLYVLSFALLLAATVYRPGLAFAVAFVAYVVLSTVALMLGHLLRQTGRHGARRVSVGRGFLLGTGALSMITLLISVGVFLAFPRVSRGWAQGGPSFASRIAGFADRVSLGEHGATIRSNPEVVLRVEFPEGPPDRFDALHWRGRSYDRFDGVRWYHSADLPAAEPTLARYRRWEGPRLEQEVYGSLLESRVLFALHPLVDVDVHNRVRPYLDGAGDARFYGAMPPRYRAVSVRGGPPPDALRDAGTQRFRDDAPARPFYLQLPELAPRVAALADSLTAGARSRHDRARAIEGWLRGLEYTRELPATAAETGIEHFLFERRAGHCEYFSTAMVVLLRSIGVPARNVNGFLGGQWNGVGDHLAVTQNEAHSWVEVWHPGFGWVTYDPTPAGGTGVAAGDQAWFWPGRILLDGLRHRWSKWVLDYSLAEQEGLFRRAADVLDPGDRDAETGERQVPQWLVWLALVAGAALVAGLLARRGRSPATRLYLALRRRYDRRGFDHIPRSAPLRFADAVEGTPGGRAAAAAARRYVRVRFGGVDSPEELAALRSELRAASRALRRG